MRYYSQEREMLFLLDLEKGAIWDFEQKEQIINEMKSEKRIDELILLRSKTIYIHAFNRHKLQEIWNLKTPEIDLYSFDDYKKNKPRNDFKALKQFEIQIINDQSLEIKRKNDNKGFYRIDTSEKITGIYAIDTTTGKFCRVKSKYGRSFHE